MPEDKPKIGLQDLHAINERYQIQYDKELEDPNKLPETYGPASRSDIALGNVYTRDTKYDKDITPTRLSKLNSIRAYNQKAGQEWWTGIKNIPENVILGLRQQQLALKALFPNVNEDWKWLYPAFALPDEIAKFQTELLYGDKSTEGSPYDQMNYLESNKNRQGQIYRKDPSNVWDMSDSAFWSSNGTQLVGSLLEFGISGFGAGAIIKGGTKALTKGLLRKGIEKMAKAGVSEGTIGLVTKGVEQGLPKLLTAGTMAYTEGALTGAQVYKQIYDELLSATGDEELARSEASKGAAKTVGLNTVINTALNIYGLGPIFKNIDNVKFGFKSLKRAANESTEEYYSRISKLDPQLKSSIGKTIAGYVPEMGFEALEEGVNVFAEKAGLGEIDANIDGLIKSLSSDEGTLSMFLGAIGGIGQMAGLDNVPKFQSNPSIGATKLDSARSTEFKARSKQYASVIENLKSDLKEVAEIENQLEVATKENNNKKIDILTEQLFNIPASRYVVNGNTDILINTLKEIKNIDNSKINEQGKTQAQLEGLSISETDNSYKSKVDKQIAKIEKYEKHYKENIKPQYGHLEEQLPGLTRELLDLHINRSSLSDNLLQAKADLQKKQVELMQEQDKYNIIDPGDATDDTKSLPEYKAVQEQKQFIDELTKQYKEAKEKELELLTNPLSYEATVKKAEKKFNELVDSVEPTDTDTENTNLNRTDTAEANKDKVREVKGKKEPLPVEIPTDVSPVDLETLLANKQAELDDNRDTSVTNNDIIENTEDTTEKDVALSVNNTTVEEPTGFTGQNNTEEDIAESINEQEGFIQDKLTNPVFSMAYGSMRFYIEDGKLIITTTNEYNEEVPTFILDPKFNVGSKITFKQLTEEDFVPFVAQRDITITYEDGTVDVVAKQGTEVTLDILQAYGVTMTPIGIYNEAGDKIGHVHDLSYIREERIAPTVNLTQARNSLVKLREDILTGKISSAIISSKSRGKVPKNTVVTTDSLESLNGTKFRLTKYAVLGNVEFFVGESESNVKDKQGNIIDLSKLNVKIQAGRSYVKLPTSNGEEFYLPLKHLKLSDFPDYTNEILSTVEGWYRKEITTADMQAVLGKYLFSAPTEKLTNEKGDSYTITENNRFYVDYKRKDGSVKFGRSGSRVKFITQGTPEEKFYSYKDQLEKILNNTYINIKETSTDEFIKNHTASNIVSIQLPTGDYSYFDNPVIEFTTSDIKAPVITPNEVTEPTVDTKEENKFTDPNTGSKLEISDDVEDQNPDFESVKELINKPTTKRMVGRIESNIFELEPNITDEKLENIYKNYVGLMHRNKNRIGKEVSLEVFKNILPKLQVFNYKDTYIFGQYHRNTATFITRFNSSPSSKELLSEAIPFISKNLDVISFVPKDYTDRLVRSGYTKSINTFPYNYKGEQMDKYMVLSNPEISNKVFGKDISEVTSDEIKNFNEIDLDYQAVSISTEDIKNAGNELDTILEKYISHFGISVKDISDIQASLNVDSLGYADILNKIAYIEDRSQLPEVAGEFIAYMMQYNTLVKDVVIELHKKKTGIVLKEGDYRNLDKNEYFKEVGKLISNDLRNKIDKNYSKSIIDNIKSIISKFFNLIKQVDFELINRNVGIISNNILQQNQKLIKASLYKPKAFGKPTKQVSLEEALDKDKLGKEIVTTLSKEGFILTGSISLAEQGTLLRPDENLLHDIDFVSPFNRETTLKKFKSLYPNAEFLRFIGSNVKLNTDSYIVPPSGYKLANIKSNDFDGKIVLESYNVVDKDGNIVGTYTNTAEEEISTGIEAKTVDLFIYEDYKSMDRYPTVSYTTEEGLNINLSNWRDIFDAKLSYARYKDIWDYNRFVPRDLESDLSPDFEKQSELIAIIDPKITSVQQIETVNFFTGYTIGKLKEGASVNEAYDSIKDLFKSFEATSEKARLVIKNMDAFLNLTTNNLSKMDITEKTFDEAEIGGGQFDEDRSIKTNPNDKATAEVKKLFSSIVDLKKDGSERKNWLGLPYYLPVDVVMNNLSGHLTNIDPSDGYNAMLVKMNDISKTTPYVFSVIKLLDGVTGQVKNQFTQWATKHIVNKRFILWFGNDDRTDLSARIVNSNQNSLFKAIEDAWYNNFNNASFIYKDEDGTYLADLEELKKLNDEFDSIYKELDSNRDADVSERMILWLSKIGIDVNEEAIRELQILSNAGRYKVGKSKLTFLQLFNSKSGIFYLMNERLKGKDAGEFDDELDKYNPVRENSGIRRFINFMMKYIDTAFSNSFRDIDGNTIYSYSVNKFTFNQLNRLSDINYLKGLREFTFQSRSRYIDKLINDEEFQEEFDVFYIDGIKKRAGSKGKSIDKMSPNEQEKFRWMLFQNQGRTSGKDENLKRWIQSTFLTTSDKSTLLGVNTEGIISKFNWNDNRVSDESLQPLLELVLSEYDRILYHQNRVAQKGLEYTSKDYEAGSSMFFLFPQLNKDYDPKYQFVYDRLFTSDGKLRPFGTDNEVQNILTEFLNDYIISLTDDKIDVWLKSGILEGTKGNINKITFLDRSYKKNIANGQVLNDKDNNQLAFYSALDYVLNTQIMNGNLYQLFAGDPANYYEAKYNDGNIQARIARTYINIGKRLAGLIAPGNSIVNTKGKDIAGIDGYQYMQLFAKDQKYVSARLKYLRTLFTETELGKYKDGIKSTDAQEYTTLQEHLYVMYHEGKLTDEQYTSLMDKYKSEGEFTEAELSIILQPMKPVYFDLNGNSKDNVVEPVYIKTSSFPLIPQLTKGQEIDNLRVWMEKVEKETTKNVRLTFESGNKLGKVSEYLDIFKPDNTVDTEELSYTNSNRILNRDGFRIQQDVPYKEGSKITTGSQEVKLLWTNLLNMMGFNYKDQKNLNGKTLKDIYDAKYKRLYEIRTEAFNRTFLLENGELNFKKLKEELITEALKRNWNPNDIAALDIISDEDGMRFIFPLYLNNSADRIESLLIAIVDNKIRKNKSTGYSYVLGSPAGFKTIGELTSNEKAGIIYTNGFNGEDLQGMHEDATGMRGAQVLVPFKFKDNDGNILNVRDYTKEVNGRLVLDTTKIDSNLLKSFGFRIPTQLHASMSYIEIVGFLPESMGDLIIAPADFIEQMGSDFDIDKLYGYMYNTMYDAKTGKLEKFSREGYKSIAFDRNVTDKLKEGTLDPLAGEKFMEKLEDLFFDEDEEAEVKELENDILDIHFSVMTNPNKDLQRQIAHPLGVGKLGDWKKDSIRNNWTRVNLSKYNVLSEEYQKRKYQNARGAKDLVGIFSVVNTFNTVLQNATDIKYGFWTKGTEKVPSEFKELKLRIVGKGTKTIASIKTLSGRFKSEIFAAFQSAAVDNEKEAILEYLNINPETSSAITAMIQSGYDENVIIPLLNQPAIIDYVEEVVNSKDTTTDSRRLSKKTIMDNLLDRMYKAAGLTTDQISDINNEVTYGEGIDLDSLNTNLKNPENITQIKALIFFNNASKMGAELQRLASALNTDSSGLPKSFIGTGIKQEQYLELLNNKKFIGIEPLLGHVQQNVLISPKGINSVASYYSLDRVNRVFGQLFSPYGENAFRYVKEQIAKIKKFEEDESTLEAREEKEKSIWNNMKSYVFAKAIEQQFGESVRSMRDRLLIGSNSLARRLKTLKKDNPKNSFLNRLDVDTAKNKNQYDKILFKAAVGSNLNELDLYTDFLGLDEDLRNDLIMYFYITGGLQEASQFGKYISNKYLNSIGFANILYNVNFDNAHSFQGFIEEYFQNNPEEVIRVNETHISMDKSKKSFVVKKDFMGDYRKGPEEFVDYLSISDYNKDDGKNYRLYKLVAVTKVGLVYDVINTKGFSLGKEYGGGNYSILPSNNKGTDKEADTKSSIFDRKDNIVSSEKTVNPYTNSSLYQRYGINQENDSKGVLNILDNIVSKSPSKGNKSLAKVLKEALKGQKGYSLQLGDKNQQLNGVVTIRDSFDNVSSLESNILHEILHIPTSNLVKGYYGEKDIKLTDNQRKAVKGLESLVNGIRLKIKNGTIEGYSWDELMEYEQLYEQYNKDKDTITDQNRFVELRDKYYGLIKATKKVGSEPRLLIEEFITLSATQTELQTMLNNTKFDGNRSTFDKLLQLIVDLFRDFYNTFKVGDQEIDPESYLFETLQDIFVLTFDKEHFEDPAVAEEPIVEQSVEANRDKITQSIQLAKEKAFKEYLPELGITYLDIPQGTSEKEREEIFGKVFDQNNKEFRKKYLKQMMSYEDYLKVKARVDSGEDMGIGDEDGDMDLKSIASIVERLATDLDLDNSTLEPNTFEGLMKSYREGTLDEYTEVGREKLEEYGLLKWIDYNPNQLTLFPEMDDNPDLGTSVAGLLRSLPREEMLALRKLIEEKKIIFNCK
jgi:hypothetical protein